jgi:hypothetical protein
MPVTLKAIYDDMKNFRNPTSKTKMNPKDDPNVRVHSIEAKASFGIKSVTYKGVADGSKGSEYAVAIQFFFKDPLSREPVKGYVKADDKKQGEFYHPVVDFSNTPVKVRCSGPNFRHRFETPLKAKKALAAPKARTYKKVPGSKRPPVNPKGAMGMCKHLTNFVSILQQNGVIKTIPGFVKK